MLDAVSIISMVVALIATVISAVSTLRTLRRSIVEKRNASGDLKVTIKSASGREREILINPGESYLDDFQKIIEELRRQSIETGSTSK